MFIIMRRNRAQAMRVLCARVYEQRRLSARQERDNERRAQGAGNADRNERIRTYNFMQVCLTCYAAIHAVLIQRTL